ncbi:MAG: PIG-L family deacetylase [Planctomycetes bacterium]|nr:PIG-L family deacetylase [Planctomycetota bacterium]
MATGTRLDGVQRGFGRLTAACVLGCLTPALSAQADTLARLRGTRDSGYVALQQAVRDAGADARVLLVASHPDDRWVLPAAYLRFRMGLRVALVLATRGGGGQNSLGPETGDALARIRTLEAESCAAHLGVSVYYLNRPDNGFSRSAEETESDWDERSTVADLARLIRKIQPDVVLTPHHPEETHGHDLALLAILPKAILKAGESTFRTPGLPAFSVSRAFRGAGTRDEERVAVSLPMDVWDQARGATYRQLAYRAMQEHHSQTPLQPLEELLEPIVELVPIQVGDEPPPRTLLRDVPDLFHALAGVVPPSQLAELRDREFPALGAKIGSLPALAAHAVGLLGRLRAISAPPNSELHRRLRRRILALNRVVLQSAGVHVFLPKPSREAAPGDEMPLVAWLRNEGRHRIGGIAIEPIGGGAVRRVGPARGQVVLEPESSLALDMRYRPPDLSERDLRALFSRDTYADPLRLRLRLTVDGLPLSIEQAIDTKLQSKVKITVAPATLLLPRGATQVRFVVGIERKTSRPVDLRLRINPPAGTAVPDHVRQVTMAERERFREFTFTLHAPEMAPGVTAMHVHLGDYRAKVHVHKVDVAVDPVVRVGLMPGVDTSTQEVLQALIGNSRLEKFEPARPIPILDRQRLQVVVADIRALRSARFRAGFARVLDFVREGGRLVVFYHKDVEFNLDDAGFRGAPFPLHIGKGRVTRQDAPVVVLQPKHVLFNHPNRVGAVDWDGWKQERGLYFPDRYDPRQFQELLQMNDPGQPVERGALLYARYGQGDYVYCALSLYRQLKNRHPGACRLFANLISPRAPE